VSRQTTTHVKSSNGGEVFVRDSRSDAPLLPIVGIERLHALRPDRVDWVFDQTQIEADLRRSNLLRSIEEGERINTRVFIEHIIAQCFALVIGLCGILGGLYAALQGHDWLGGIVSTISIGTLAGNFLKKGK
jgi:hypothetical protein